MAHVRKLVVCGVGLIGGSFALVLKAAGLVDQVVGMGRQRTTLEEARRLGVIDSIGTDWTTALEGADLVFLGMPVGQMPPVMATIAPLLGPETLVTDGGSTKQDVVAAARAAFGNSLRQFIPGHPIAGAEKSGPGAAHADLYRGRRVVLTPLPENETADVNRIRALWEAAGAQVSQLTSDAHDRVFAAVSHLPHLLAFALVDAFAARSDADLLFGFAAGGFRDFTRIASSHPEMWRDISLANRHALMQEIDAYMAQLLRIRVLLAAADGVGLEALFDSARTAREAWLAGLLPSSDE